MEGGDDHLTPRCDRAFGFDVGGLSLGALTSETLHATQAQLQAAWPDQLVGRPLREAFPGATTAQPGRLGAGARGERKASYGHVLADVFREHLVDQGPVEKRVQELLKIT